MVTFLWLFVPSTTGRARELSHHTPGRYKVEHQKAWNLVRKLLKRWLGGVLLAKLVLL